ncbi:MAG: hypothetical protein PW734_12530 [Verrucomicrobium sp.]|nr:hypothetical protein [Verrucomicrobium sp.]
MIRLLFLFTLLLAASAQAQVVANPNVGFAYTAPPGWSIRQLPGISNPVALGPVADKFSPNINVVDEAFAGSLEEYVAKNKQAFKQTFPDASGWKESSFSNDSGLKGVKAAVRDTQENRKLRQIFYFFSGKQGRMIVVTCTALVDDDASLALFDKVLQTFQVDRS